METPRILAIADVHLQTCAEFRDEMYDFYGEVLGLRHETAQDDPRDLVFGGMERSGPRVCIAMGEEAARPSVRRDVLIQVESLDAFAELLADRQIDYERISGFSYYDRRFAVTDPVGHRIEIVASHSF